MSERSMTANPGFTVQDSLNKIGMKLNLPPIEGHHQLPSVDLQRGHSIASLHIHVERTIGRIKLFKIVIGACLANKIVVVCAYLSNFHPVFVPSHAVDM